ncbi:hypothetical protein M409DRAFT_53578 [Zasmidium cellare ATCC 36951]|uniref:F-box domain-containing protein n=1 Tax=Zasmidium cellare ATCC 36951 TaxID=1080233 RepID=A0A6A6CR96_ZASCE|nr:uncharacterized protein M409DRAFT_53578 [Zasmidium cellare ATCC 36951]KAF2168299.1 hypothetical protein M409DRAFT_53578 [Zasmidium cellare ATCC 36951]
MPTKIQQIVAMLDGLDNCELESIRSAANQVIESRPGTSCKLLSIPAEIRNFIYHFVARGYLDSYGSYEHEGGRCGLFRANKQLRVEFMDICYDKKTVGRIQLASAELDSYRRVKKMSWVPVRGEKIKKLILDGGERITIFPFDNFKGATDWAERTIEVDDWCVAEGDISNQEARIVGIHSNDDGNDGEGLRKHAVFAIKKTVIREEGLEDELPVFDDGTKLI